MIDKDCDGRVMIAIPWDQWDKEAETRFAWAAHAADGHVESAYRLGSEGENPSAEDEQSGDAYAPSISDETLALMRHLDDVKATRDRLLDLVDRTVPVVTSASTQPAQFLSPLPAIQTSSFEGTEMVSMPVAKAQALRARINWARNQIRRGNQHRAADVLDDLYDELGDDA